MGNTVGISIPLPGGDVYDTTFPMLIDGEYVWAESETDD